jgi:hypothetical protein
VPIIVLPFGFRDAELREVTLCDVPALGRGARERKPDAVEDRALAQVRDILRDVGGFRGDDEGRDLVGDRDLGFGGCFYGGHGFPLLEA